MAPVRVGLGEQGERPGCPHPVGVSNRCKHSEEQGIEPGCHGFEYLAGLLDGVTVPHTVEKLSRDELDPGEYTLSALRNLAKEGRISGTCISGLCEHLWLG